MKEQRIAQKSLGTSFRFLWKRSPLWRFTLLTASTALLLVISYPIWQQNGNMPANPASHVQAQQANTSSHTAHIVAATHNIVPPTDTHNIPMAQANIQQQPTATHSVPEFHSPPVLQTKIPSTPAPTVSVQTQAQTVQPEHVPQRSMPVLSNANPSQATSCNGLNRPGFFPKRHLFRKVVGFLPKWRALEMIRITERNSGEKISPRFVNNQRAVLSTLSGFGGRNIIALVPENMTVNIGDVVEFTTGGNFDPKYPCNYVPNLIDKIVRTAEVEKRY